MLLVNSREWLQVKYRGGYVPHMSFLLFLARFTNTRGRSRTDGCVSTQCFSNLRVLRTVKIGTNRTDSNDRVPGIFRNFGKKRSR